jgi:hypothetical protein
LRIPLVSKERWSDLHEAYPTTDVTPSISPLPWHAFSQWRNTTYYGIGQWREVTNPSSSQVVLPTTCEDAHYSNPMEASSSPSTLNPLAEPFRSARPPTSNPPLATDPAHEQLFHTLSTYPFHQDAEFQSGLSAILGHPETPTSPEEVEQNADLVLKAQCFYFSRSDSLHVISPHNSITHHHELLS